MGNVAGLLVILVGAFLMTIVIRGSYSVLFPSLVVQPQGQSQQSSSSEGSSGSGTNPQCNGLLIPIVNICIDSNPFQFNP